MHRKNRMQEKHSVDVGCQREIEKSCVLFFFSIIKKWRNKEPVRIIEKERERESGVAAYQQERIFYVKVRTTYD